MPEQPEDNSKRWLIVIPVFTHVLPAAFYNFLGIMLRTARDLPDYKFDVMQAERQILHMVMNQAAASTVERGYAGLIFFDDDCLPPVDAVVRLIRHIESGKEFVAAMGFMRNYPYTTTVGRYYEEGPTLVGDNGECAGFYWLDKLTERERGLIKVDFCGVPLAVMTRQLIERVEKPLFGTTDEQGGSMTHDVFMCRRIQAAGGDVWVDTSIECGHITAAPVVDGVTREAARAAVRMQEQARKTARVEQVA